MSLKGFQEDFKVASVSKTTPYFPKGYLPYDPQESIERFSIYQNNIIENLVGVLANTFAACEKLVGEDFFKQTARSFVKDNLPKEAALYKYGKDFVSYFGTLGRQHNYAYWRDVAAFEWAENECYFEADTETLSPQELTNFSDADFQKLCVFLSPTVRLLETNCNIKDIVNFAKSDGVESGKEIESDRSEVLTMPHYYLFYPTETKVIVDEINKVVFGALQSLGDPIPMEVLAEKFSNQGCEQRFPSFLQLLFEKRLLCLA